MADVEKIAGLLKAAQKCDANGEYSKSDQLVKGALVKLSQLNTIYNAIRGADGFYPLQTTGIAPALSQMWNTNPQDEAYRHTETNAGFSRAVNPFSDYDPAIRSEAITNDKAKDLATDLYTPSVESLTWQPFLHGMWEGAAPHMGYNLGNRPVDMSTFPSSIDLGNGRSLRYNGRQWVM